MIICVKLLPFSDLSVFALKVIKPYALESCVSNRETVNL